MDDVTHAEKLRIAGVRKYGSEEAWRKSLSNAGKKASRPGTGGFKHLKGKDPERLREISVNAARARWAREDRG